MFRKKLALLLLPIVVGVGLGVFLFVSNVEAGTSVDGNFTILPKVDNVDNISGAIDAQWVFTVTTTAFLNSQSGPPPEVVRFILPTTTDGTQPFLVSLATSTSSTNINLATSQDQLGVSSTILADGRTAIWGFVNQDVATGTRFSVTLGGINNASGTLEALANLEWTVEAGSLDGGFPAGLSAPFSAVKFTMTSTAGLTFLAPPPPPPPAPGSAAVSNVALTDSDTAGYGLDGRDFTVTWTPSSTSPSGYQFTQVYIVSSSIDLSTENLSTACNGGPCQPVMMFPQFNMATATVPQFMQKDSAGASWSTSTDYVAWVYTMATAPSIASSSVVSFDNSYDTPPDTSAPQIDHNPAHAAKQSAAATFYAFVFDDQTNGMQFADVGDGGAEFFKLYYTSSTWPGLPASVDAVIVDGAGELYSFTVPTSSMAGTELQYYLVASDRAAPTPNVRYFCATQNPTSAGDCQSNPFTVNVAAAGSRSVSGQVFSNNNGVQVGLGTTTVFAGGYAASAVVSDGSGNYTISNLPDNDAFEFTAVKMGYNKISRMETIGTSDKTGVNLVLNQGSFGFFMGEGGDTNGGAPRVVFSGPPDGMQGVQLGEKIRVGFNQPMDASTINAPDATATSSNVYLLNTFTAAKVAGAVTYCVNRGQSGCSDLFDMDQNTILFTPSANLSTGTAYALIVNESVKSQSGQSVQGNRSGGGHRIVFNTIGNDFSAFGGDWSTQFNQGGQYMPSFVRSMTPAPGMTVAGNSKILLEFDQALDSTSVDSNTILLRTGGGAAVAGTVTITLDSNEKRFVTISHDSLAAGEYEVRVQGSVKSAGGVPMRSDAGQVAFSSRFSSSGSTDSTGPTLYALLPNNSTNVPTDKVFEFGANEPLLFDTVNSNNITMSRGATAVSISTGYDSGKNSVYVVPDDVLTPNTAYTIVFGSSVTDLAGQTMATATYSYTTGGVSTSTPAIKEVRCDDYTCKIFFTKSMNHDMQSDSNWVSSTLNYERWNLTQGGPNKISAFTVLSYDAFEKSLTIQGVGLTVGGGNFTLAAVGISDTSDNLLADASVVGTVEDSKETFGSFGDVGMFGPPTAGFTGGEIGGGEFKPQGFGNFTADQFAFGQADMAFAFNPTAGADVNVFQTRFAPGVVLEDGDQVVLTFPDGTNVANAVLDQQSPFYSDFNQFMAGTVTGTTVAVDTAANKVTITLGVSGSPIANDPITIDLKKITNPAVPKSPQTGGYTLGIKLVRGGAVLTNKTSMPYYIMAGGSRSITVNVDTSGHLGTDDGTVYLHGGGPSGPMDKQLTLTNGDISEVDGTSASSVVYNNLTDGCYFVGTDPLITLGTNDYYGQMAPEPICVNAGNPSPTKNIILTSASGGSTATLTVKFVQSNGVTAYNFGGKDIDIFAGGPNKFVVKTLTNVGTSTADGYQLKLNANGHWFVGMGPAMPKSASGGKPANLGVMPPPSVDIVVNNIETTPVLTSAVSTLPPSVSYSNGVVTFKFASADKTVVGTVKDASGNGLANVEVFAHAQGFGSPVFTQTNASGTFSLSVTDYGNYEFGAMSAGMPPTMKHVELKNESGLVLYVDGKVTTTLALTLKKAAYTISGKVLNGGTNGIGYAPVVAVDANGNSVFSQTTADGSYTLFVDNGTWTVRAELPPSKTDACGAFTKTVIVSGASQSNQNITSSDVSCSTLIGNVSVNSVNLTNVPLFIEQWDSDNSRPVAGGMRKNTATDSSGNYSVKLVDGTYRIGTWDPTYGELSVTTTLAGDDTKNITVGALQTITFEFTGGTAAMNAFVELKNSTDNNKRVTKQINGLNNAATFSVPSGSTYNYFVNVFGIGNYNGSVAAGDTATLNLGSSSDFITVTGTVYVDSSTTTGKAGALVSFANATTTVSAVTDDNGQYSIKLKAGSYTVADSLAGYVPVQAASISFTTSTAAYDFGGDSPDQTSLKTAGYVISGTVNNSSDSPMSTGYVWGTNASGTVVTAQVNSNGTYSLPVTNGVWTLKAVGPLHVETTLSPAVTVSGADQTGKNITLTTAGVGVNVPTSTTGMVAASSGGSLNDSSASGIKLTAGAGVLDTGSGNVTINFEKNFTAPDTATYNSLGNASFSITAAGDSTIKNLSGNAEIQLDYTSLLAALPDGVAESDLKLAYYSPERGDYVAVEGGFTVDTSTNKITGLVNHFTDFVITYVSPASSSAGITVTESDSATAVTEGSTTDSVSYVLTSQPTADVVITPSVNAAKISVSPTSLTFTNSNWATPQTITVTAVNNSVVDGTRTDTMTHAVVSIDGNYNGLSVGDITVTITDNDVASSGGGGGGGSYTPPVVVVTTTVATTTLTTTTVATTTVPVSTTNLDVSVVTPTVVAPIIKVLAAINPESKIVMTLPTAFSYQPGTVLKFVYQYTNESAKKATVKIVRQMLDSKGKVVASASANKTLKVGAAFTGDIKQVLYKNLKPGEYTMRVRILGAKNKVLEENSFKFEVEKLKKKYFILNDEVSSESSITFDAKILLKVKSNTLLPKILKVKYDYFNNTESTQKVRMVRELVDANNKVLEVKTGKWTVKAGKSDNTTFTQKLTDKLAAGNYTIRIRAYDQNTKELLGENSLGFTVELK